MRSSRFPTGIGPRRRACRPPCSTTCSIPTTAPSSRPSRRSRRSSTRPSPRCGRRSRRRNRTCWRSAGSPARRIFGAPWLRLRRECFSSSRPRAASPRRAPISIEPRGRRLRCPPSEAHCERRTSPAVPMAGTRLGLPARRRQATTIRAGKASWKANPTTTCTAPWEARRTTPSWCRSYRRSIRSSSCTMATSTGCGTCGRAGRRRSGVRRCREVRISRRGRASVSCSSAIPAASPWRRRARAITPR